MSLTLKTYCLRNKWIFNDMYNKIHEKSMFIMSLTMNAYYRC